MANTGGDADGRDDGGTDAVSHSGVQSASGYAGSAVAALVLGVAAVCLIVANPLIGGLTGLSAVIVGLRSRKQLRNDSMLRGEQISLAGFLLGLVATLFVLAPFVIQLVMMGAFFVVR